MSTGSINNNSASESTVVGNRLPAALFLHSLSIIGFQIILMRILSVNQWDHFANMIISIAMLGFGVSGTWLALSKQRLLRNAGLLIPLLMIISSILMILAYRLSQHEFLKFDTFLVFSSTDQLLRLVLFVMLFFLPFLSASLAIGIIYVRHVEGIGKLYFSNLLGSGIGGVIALLLLGFMMPANALVVASLFPVMAALLILPGRKSYTLLLSILVTACLITLSIVRPLPLALSQYKALSRTLQLPHAVVAVEHSGISSLAHVVESQYLRYAPGLSLNFTGSVPVKPMVFVNGNAAGFIPDDTRQEGIDILDYSGYKLPYIMADHRTVAIVESGTGELVAQALRNGAENVFAFEPQITLLDALEKWHKLNHPSVYDAQQVSLHRIDARAFFNTNRQSYDLIILPSVGSFGGTSGLQAVKEDFTLTVEALQTYWDNLSDDGLLSVTVYTDFPPRATLKLTGIIARMLAENDIADPVKHIAALRSWTSITFTVSRSPLTAGQVSSVRSFADEMGFDPFILPGISPEERYFYHYIEGKELFMLTDKILTGSNAIQDIDYMFYIAPATDDKPYFSRYIRLNRISSLLKEFRWQELPFVELGYIIVWLTFVIALILSLIFILIPVLRFSRSRGNLPILLYFGGIGLGFMFAEIILIQRFVLYLGQPVYAVSAVLSVMLIASGAGSYVSSRLQPGASGHRSIFLAVFLLLIFYALFLTPVLRHTSGAPLMVKLVLTFIIVSLPAFFMGMPFPLGLQAVSRQFADKVAWAWGVNGFFSVIAAPLALIIAVESGSRLVMSGAATAYLIAFVALLLFKSKK